MIKKLRKKFIVTSLLSVFALLTTILLVINLVNFSLVAADADRILDQMIPQGGAFREGFVPGEEQNGIGEEMPVSRSATTRRGDFGPNGPKGPDSPELSQTIRFFTVNFDGNGAVVNTTIKMSVVSEDTAIEWARMLANKKSGWSKTYYRYRVWENGDMISVTVIDQSRELLPSFRVLIASCVGEVVGLIVTLLALLSVAKVVTDPVEKSDRKQKRFIEDAAFELKDPIVSIDALRLAIEEKQGQSQETQMIARETGHLTKVVQGMDTLLLLEDESIKRNRKEIDLSMMMNEIAAVRKSEAETQGKTFTLRVQDGVKIMGDETAIERLLSVSLKNAVEYAGSTIEASLSREGERIRMEFVNDTEGLEDGPLDSVFERFWRSPEVRERGLDGAGLGLSVAKEIVTMYGGRISAEVKDGYFRLKIEL